jgi:hypothetical protein
MKAMRFVMASVGVLVAVAPLTATARPHRVDEIPNGSDRTCLNCHLTTGGEHFTDFGADVRANLMGTGLTISEKQVNWAAVYMEDSDGDTWTNGEELGDPNGTWTIGAPDPAGPTFNPGDPDSHPPGVCDNGVLEPDEDCEGAEMRSTLCAELDLGDGTLACASCRFDISDCSYSAPGGGTGGGASASGSDDGGSCALGRGRGSSSTGALLVGLALLGLAGRARRGRRAG